MRVGERRGNEKYAKFQSTRSNFSRLAFTRFESSRCLMGRGRELRDGLETHGGLHSMLIVKRGANLSICFFSQFARLIRHKQEPTRSSLSLECAQLAKCPSSACRELHFTKREPRLKFVG